MTDSAIIAASYAAERNYSHNIDDVIDSSDAVGAWGTTKESTTELVDLSGNGNIADIHGAMPTEGFIQGRRFDGIDDYIGTPSITVDRNNGYICCIYNLKTNPSANFSGAFMLAYAGKYQSYIGIKKNLLYIESEGDTNGDFWVKSLSATSLNKINIIECFANNGTVLTYYNGVLIDTQTPISNITFNKIGGVIESFSDCEIFYSLLSTLKSSSIFNTIARLPFWSINYTDYPDNVTEYNSGDIIPYSSGRVL